MGGGGREEREGGRERVGERRERVRGRGKEREGWEGGMENCNLLTACVSHAVSYHEEDGLDSAT